MVRAFVAVGISQEARDALADVISRLQQRGVSGVRWVRPEGVHLTLKFLGDVNPGLLEGILAAMERGAWGTGPFRLTLSDVGAFPSTESPRILWVGLEGGLEPLVKLQARIEEELHQTCGFPIERRAFAPHLTLGRTRENLSADERRRLGMILAGVALEAEVSWDVGEVHLIRSTLTPSGAVYDVLAARPRII